MDSLDRVTYDPRTHTRLSFLDAVPAFRDATDTPRAFLERCIEVIERREPQVKAFTATNLPNARAAADASTARYRAGRPLSAVDGLPMAIKDLYETADMPTQLGSPLFSGWYSGKDAAHVYALRRGGALIVGKTVTTEFGQATPGPTRNPFDLTRTPGGSSSGTSAAVGANMVPAGTGSQVRGSIIRPAGYCGNYALKPTYGALNRLGGYSLAPSQSVLGVHAATLADCWATAHYISSAAGGDAGSPGLYGPPLLGDARRLERVIRLDTRGWGGVEPEAGDAFERFVRRLGECQVKVLSRRDDPRIEALERALCTIPDFMVPIFQWEMRWPAWIYRDRGAHLVAKSVLDRLAKGEAMTIEEYRVALTKRDALREAVAAAGEIAGTFVTLCSHGPAPVGMGVGDPVFADMSSCTLGPAIAVPVLAVGGLPLGIQLVGLPHQDHRLAAEARWVSEAVLA